MGERMRSLRAIAVNAVTWGVAWAIAGGAMMGVLGLFSSNPSIDSLPERLGYALLAAASWGVRFGIIGGIIGTAFASVIRFGYRGRRLSDINPLHFAALGAIVGGVGVPLFLQTMNVVFGDGPIAWNLVTDDAVLAGVFGAVAGGGSILLARRAGAVGAADTPAELESGDDAASFTDLSDRSRSTTRTKR